MTKNKLSKMIREDLKKEYRKIAYRLNPEEKVDEENVTKAKIIEAILLADSRTAEAVQDKEETMKAENTQEQEVKAEEQKAEEKKAVDLVAIAEQAAQALNGTVIDVKPGGKGLKVGKTRICVIYVNRHGKVRMKTNKVDEATVLLHQDYDPSIEAKMTADKRDVIIDFNYDEADTVVSFIQDLAKADGRTKAVKAAGREEAKAAKAAAEAAKKAAAKAAKEAAKKAKAEEKKAKAEQAAPEAANK